MNTAIDQRSISSPASSRDSFTDRRSSDQRRRQYTFVGATIVVGFVAGRHLSTESEYSPSASTEDSDAIFAIFTVCIGRDAASAGSRTVIYHGGIRLGLVNPADE